MSKYTQKEIIYTLRNPYGYTPEYLRGVHLAAADLLEENVQWAIDMFKWCEDNGLDTKAYPPGKKLC